MSTLTIPDVDDAVVDHLRRLAATHQRSVEAEARLVLARGLSQTAWDDARAACLAVRAQMPPSDIPAEVEVRRMRDER